MTNEEALEQFYKFTEITNGTKLMELYGDAVYTAGAALEKAEKYRWHDLRKNPEDLPEDIYDCAIVDSDGNKYVGWYGTLCGRTEWNITNPNYENDYDYATPEEFKMPTRIIAWKEIEPFEGVSE